MEESRQFDRGRIRFSFKDRGGEEFASFYMNPTDVGLLARAEEVADFFEKRAGESASFSDAASIAAYNSEIEEKINYLLGYDASSELFGQVTATTVSPDGEIFAHAVLDMIAGAIAPELERRGKLMHEHMAKYTAKYEAGK